MNRRSRGAAAEDRALLLLRARGLQLLERNYRCRFGELDLVMRDKDSIVIVEVRQRSHNSRGGAAASIDGPKQAKLIAATRHFLYSRPSCGCAPLRFDVVLFQGDSPPRWIRGAFRPDGD